MRAVDCVARTLWVVLLACVCVSVDSAAGAQGGAEPSWHIRLPVVFRYAATSPAATAAPDSDLSGSAVMAQAEEPEVQGYHGDPGLSIPAADYALLPRLEVRESYNDNVFFDDDGDLEQRVSPSLEFRARTERLEARVKGVVDIYNYLDLTRYNRVNQYYTLDTEYAMSRRSSAGLAASWRRDHTFETDLEESGLIQDRNRRDVLFLSPSYKYQLDERSLLAFDLRFQDTDFDEDQDTDSTVYGGGVTYSRLLDNQKSRILGNVDLQQVEYDPVSGDGEQLTVQVMTGLAHAYAPNKDVVVRGGVSYTDSSFETGGLDLDDDNWGFLFDATANWQWELTDLSLGASRSITASSFGENITRDRLLLRLNRRLTERLQVFGNVSLYRYETEGIVVDEVRRTLQISPGLTYRLTEMVDLRFGYSYTATEDVDDNDSESRNIVFGEVALRFPDLLN